MGTRGIGAKPVRKSEKAKGRTRKKPWEKAGLSRAERVIAFGETLIITSGIHAGRRFKFRPWQREIVAALYATDEGKRIVRQGLVSLPRKQGKSALASILALCHLAGPEAEQRGQVYSAATDKEQAGLILDEMIAFILADAELSDRIIIRAHNKTLEDVVTGSRFRSLPADGRKAHGLSPSFVVCDEVAQWHGRRGRDLFEALETGMGARAEPLLLTISTKSGDPTSLMSELVAYGEKVISGDISDPAFHATIYSAPDDADPWAEETWFACNPALGDFRSLEDVRDAAEKAKRMPSKESGFRLLFLNQAYSEVSGIISGPDWRACHSDFDVRELHGKECFFGLDLSSTTDLTALAAFFPNSGHLLNWFWVPEDGLDDAEIRDGVPYALWRKQNLLEAIPGRVIDHDFIARRIGEIASDFNVVGCAYDRWKVKELLKKLDEAGVKIPLEPWGQGYKDMGPSLDAFEIAVLQQKLKHPSHPVMTWNVSNARAMTDPHGSELRKPVKNRSTGRIDGMVAALMACGFAARTAPKKPSVYRSRGLITVGAAA